MGLTEEACPRSALADEFVAGRLAEDEAAAYRAHLSDCASCRTRVAGHTSAREASRTPPPSSVVTRSSTLAIKESLGAGGMGVVYRATDPDLNRDVALKLMSAPADPRGPNEPVRQTVVIARTPADVAIEERFLREAYITARLQHPSIVPVYQTGRLPSGAPFYTMRLISGRSLRDAIGSARELKDRLALLPQVLAAADAVAYAHSRRVIHRDLKPANIMVGPFGETLVIDWGLAKDLDAGQSEPDGAGSPSPAGMTQTGAVLGTPGYMAPEQARGEDVDERADVHALGGVLFNVLAGSPPRAPDRGRLPPGTPRELSAIVGRAMAVRASDRYASAAELAEDLRRFQTGQLVGAHEYSTATLIGRWMKRHRAPLAVAGSFVVLLAVTLAVSFRRVSRARNLAEAERAAAIAKRNELTLLQSQSMLATDPTQSMAWLKTYPTDGIAGPELQAIAADAAALGVARHILDTGNLLTTAFSPDGRRLVTAGTGGHIDAWDVERGVLLARRKVEFDVAQAVSSPDGSTVAMACTNGEVRLWDWKGETTTLGKHSGVPLLVRFSPDGHTLASSDSETVLLHDLRAKTSRTLHSGGSIQMIAFSRDGTRLAWGDAAGGLHVLALASGTERMLAGHRWNVQDVSFSDDGAHLASAGSDGTVRIWSLATGAGRTLGSHPGGATIARFAAHGSRLVTFGADRTIATWDTERGVVISRRAGPLEPVVVFVVSDDATLAATGDLAGNLELFDLKSGDSQPLLTNGEGILTMAFSPAHDWLVSGGTTEGARLWRVSFRARTPFADPTGEIAPHVVFAPDGKTVATDAGSAVRLCDRATASCRALRGEHPNLSGIDFSPDGKHLLSAGFDGTARVWDVATGDARVLVRPSPLVRKALYSPDGSLTAVASSDGLVRLWRDGAAEPQILRGHTAPILDMAFSPDGKSIATASEDKTVRLWELPAGSSRVFAGHEHEVHLVVFSPDGQRLASGSWDSTVRVWERAGGPGRKLAGHSAEISALAFVTPDRLLSSSYDNTVVDWNLASGRHDVFRGHQGKIRMFALAPDRRTFASCSEDRTIRLWDLSTGATEVLRGHKATVRWVSWSPDGKSLASASDDHTVRVWAIDAAPSVPRDPAALRTWLATRTSAVIPASK